MSKENDNISKIIMSEAGIVLAAKNYVAYLKAKVHHKDDFDAQRVSNKLHGFYEKFYRSLI